MWCHHASGKICIFCQFFLKNRIILILDGTLVPNLMCLGLLSPEISFGENIVTHADTQLILPSVNLLFHNRLTELVEKTNIDLLSD